LALEIARKRHYETCLNSYNWSVSFASASDSTAREVYIIVNDFSTLPHLH